MVLPGSTGISRVPAYSGNDPRPLVVHRLQGSHLLRRGFPAGFGSYGRTDPRDRQISPDRPYNPARTTAAALHPRGLGSSPFARRYLGNHGCFLFLEVLRCFSSLGSPPQAYVFSQGMTGHYPGRVSPFGHPRINARVQLPLAYRSLPRPSSPACTKASTLRPYCLIPSLRWGSRRDEISDPKTLISKRSVPQSGDSSPLGAHKHTNNPLAHT